MPSIIVVRKSLVLWALGAFSLVQAATLRIDNPDGGLGAAKVRDNHVLVGLVGDTVVLGPGDHELQIDAPRDHTLVIALRVDGEQVTLVDARTAPGNCGPSFETTWDAPKLAARATTAGAAKKARQERADAAVAPGPDAARRGTTLLVSTPKFGAPSDRGACALPSMLSCTKQFTTVSVDSVPPGGEIWVAGERTSVKTRGLLSVPFCPGYDKTKSLLVRMPGRVTCLRDVPMSEGGRVDVRCDLPLPP